MTVTTEKVGLIANWESLKPSWEGLEASWERLEAGLEGLRAGWQELGASWEGHLSTLSNVHEYSGTISIANRPEGIGSHSSVRSGSFGPCYSKLQSTSIFRKAWQRDTSPWFGLSSLWYVSASLFTRSCLMSSAYSFLGSGPEGDDVL